MNDYTLTEVISLGRNLYSLRIKPGLNVIYPYLPGNAASVSDMHDNPLLKGWLLSNPYTDDDLMVTGYLKSKPPGTGKAVQLAPASGSFVLRPLSDYRRYFLFFAEGKGILPLISMVHAVLRVEQRSRIRLIWIAGDEYDFFRNQLEQLEAMVHGRLEVLMPEHTADMKIWLNSLFGAPGESPDRTYISGNPQFVTLLINRLSAAGLDTSKIRINSV